jgi:hypothetical protein
VNGLNTRVYRFSLGGGGTSLSFAGAVTVTHPAPSYACGGNCDGSLAQVTAIQEASDGALYLVGNTAPHFLDNLDFFSLPQTLVGDPTLATMAPSITWSMSPPATTVSAQRMTGCDLALPVSAILRKILTADLDTDGDVDAADLAMFQNCRTRDRVPYSPANLPPGCTAPVGTDNKLSIDFDKDGDIDPNDFGAFQRQYTGSAN